MSFMAAREHGSKTGSGFISSQQEVSLGDIIYYQLVVDGVAVLAVLARFNGHSHCKNCFLIRF